ncbi:RNA polymerase, sigma-24 subunit, ECF subfamily [Pirellula staleyi DSM 6068]|uniref:RNA polymerase, sigma-24 subunit, ECF subfamily n=1 Tax=Pirellula staleyi (strain ATCC 27377 / DSM 6068 / ICPB 4128) TaxID=530564 RepID=D2R6Z9_PIRSD|nr:RNA polymerase sigma factor [Pirellula staleyi]ADB19202.1 RNA polymerase, sigma-24 subunit, ECF subfamily [Pirellula staleyi DSM 6068]
MAETSASLLDRLRTDPDSAEWERMVQLYSPLIRNYLRRQEVLSHDADDLVQDVLAVVVRRLKDFEHNQRIGAFRTWLRTITVNVLRDHWRSRKARPMATGASDFQQFLADLEDPSSELSQAFDLEHDRYITRQLLAQLEKEFEPTTWRAFTEVALLGRSASEVAQDLQISTNAVFIAKSRVLSRLRQEAKGLVEENSEEL